ncbi:MAG: hypothetical protein IKW84_09620 [Bacteroidaceae bacterium]|nr:hypothetical protein [Bacteroidaceae bacterium]
MKRIYLDWGVISNLKKPEYAEVRDFLLTHKDSLFFVYSPAHFEDAMRSEGDERLLQDIKMLESLVDNHYIAYIQNETSPFLLTPTEYYSENKGRKNDVIPDYSDVLSSISKDIPVFGGLLETLLNMPFPIPEAARSYDLFNKILPGIPETPTLNDVLHSSAIFMNNMMFNKEYYKDYRSSIWSAGLKLEPNAGKWEAKDVVPNITAYLKALGVDKTFEEFVLMGLGNKDKDDKYQFFIAAYNILDLIGYKADKLPKAGNAMNSVNTDAQHAYYAAFCDYFIAQDTHLADKTQALYSEFKISTKVITPSEAIHELTEVRYDDLGLLMQEQLKEDNIVEREDGAVAYKLSYPFLGLFTHCVVYEQQDGTLLEFKLVFKNYSNFIFYEEAGRMIDAVSDYFGRPSREEYESVREKIVFGDVNAAINWVGDGITSVLKADSERNRPELFIKING